MAEKSFGSKEIKLDGSGTPTIASPSDLIVTAGITSFSANVSAAVTSILFNNLPTSDPGVAGRLWRSGTDLKISVGST